MVFMCTWLEIMGQFIKFTTISLYKFFTRKLRVKQREVRKFWILVDIKGSNKLFKQNSIDIMGFPFSYKQIKNF